MHAVAQRQELPHGQANVIVSMPQSPQVFIDSYLRCLLALVHEPDVAASYGAWAANLQSDFFCVGPMGEARGRDQDILFEWRFARAYGHFAWLELSEACWQQQGVGQVVCWVKLLRNYLQLNGQPLVRRMLQLHIEICASQDGSFRVKGHSYQPCQPEAVAGVCSQPDRPGHVG